MICLFTVGLCGVASLFDLFICNALFVLDSSIEFVFNVFVNLFSCKSVALIMFLLCGVVVCFGFMFVVFHIIHLFTILFVFDSLKSVCVIGVFKFGFNYLFNKFSLSQFIICFDL